MLIEQKEMPVHRVALAVGFNSKSTFNHVFQKLTGKTPSEFRAGSVRNL